MTSSTARALVAPLPTPAPTWHALEATAALAALGSRPAGLDEVEVEARRREHGPNLIPAARPDGPLKLLLRQLNSPLLFVLLGSGALALLMGKLTDGAVVLGVVALNALVGFIQEYKAQKAITALDQMVPEHATVRRRDLVRHLAAVEIVPGDVVLLQSGDRVPADLRLIAIKSLQIDEAALTGEAVPVAKRLQPVGEDAALGDRTSMAYGGTMVTYGTGVGVAVTTGGATELGRISSLLHQTEQLDTPLTRSMAKVSLWLTWVILAVTGALFGISLWRGYPLADATVAAISLAVAAIPEGLPAIITIALAIGVRRMARRRVIIRSLPAVETLGSTTVICSDKTGTLTKNEMTVQAIWTPRGHYTLTGTGYDPAGGALRAGAPLDAAPEDLLAVVRAGVACNDAQLRRDARGGWLIEGDPTEAALLVSGRKVALDAEMLRRDWPRLDAVPFESERQLMGTLHRTPGGGGVIFIKGAPEVVFRRCAGLDPSAARAAIEEIAGDGMRVLAMAQKQVAAQVTAIDEADLGSGFDLLGLQGMSDPPRPEAIEAVRLCQAAGITVKMITGDHALTARAIAGQLGLSLARPVVTGAELGRMSDAELGEQAAAATVFARVAPEHKLRLVSALQQRGHVVAMTGDGVNDAPALKRADIGAAMGIAGTAVSRQAADMVLTDDNFASIVAAVEEGRRVFDNLIKSLVFVLPTNIGEALIIMVAVMFFPIVAGQPEMPILPVQILWVNLVATVALALPLAFEAMEPNVMHRPPRPPGAPILDTFVITRTVYVAVLMTAGAIGLFQYELGLRVASGVVRELAMREAQTMAVTSIIALQIFYLLTCRSLQRSIFSIGVFSNPIVFLGIGVLVALQLAFVYLPALNRLFASAPLDPWGWLRAFGVGAAVWPAVMFEKWLRRRRAGDSTAGQGR